MDRGKRSKVDQKPWDLQLSAAGWVHHVRVVGGGDLLAEELGAEGIVAGEAEFWLFVMP